MSSELTVVQEQGVFASANSFEHAQRVAKMLSSSSLIPKDFQGNIQNVMIALEMSNRIGASPMMVMQNLYIVHGKPSWSSTFIISAINASKKFTPLRFQMEGEGNTRSCVAWALELDTKERLESPKVTIEMAIAEGWMNKAGSKWKTMPELMLRYRSATFFGRLYAPEILMGMSAAEEIHDIQVPTQSMVDKQNEAEKKRIEDHIIEAADLETLSMVEDFVDAQSLRDIYEAKKQTLTNGTNTISE